MIWFGIAIGIFLLIVGAMYVPDWIRWARWNSRRKRLPERKAKKLRARVAAPFWSSYVGPAHTGGGGGGGGASDCGSGGFDLGGGMDGGGGDGGSCD